MKPLTTELQVVNFVNHNSFHYSMGLKLPSGSNGGQYAVNYNHRVYHSNDTRKLVEMICKDNNIPFVK